ncbi:uncharacterized protein LOC128737701 isoform X2 [Sabethes cyaneus]|uniref:uncharacterized protein LOC128737701 isoform X2 n=1 Tax=Sabethes cyaneus TaxID=53552 RepID=UPI00237EC724|nr:uncharacterized protein LOC128737701 isoform X2 [Sabethes cyaneus]
MTSQAVYCLSLQIRPPAEEGNNAVSTSSGLAVSANELSKMVTTTTPVTAPGGAIITGLDSKSVTITEAASRQFQSQIQLQQVQAAAAQVQAQAAATVQPQHSNIILVRGSRSENGQIILQNTHELLSLLNDEDKPILLQHQRLKTKTAPEVASTAGNTILFQPAIKSSTVDGTILLQSDGIKKTAITSEGAPIFLQQRLNKNGSTEGPILLRTLKRIDKSQSILVIRNATTTASVANASSTSSASVVANATTAGVTVNAATLASSSNATIVKAKPLQVQSQSTVGNIGSGTNTATVSGASAREEADGKKESATGATVAKVVQKPINLPLGADGEPIKLPENLESLPRADHFPNQRHRWNTNEEIAAILISFDKHSEWQSKEVKTRPKSGSMLLYSRKKVRYRRDGYCWKKRKDGKTTREDHMKLKVQGTECIYGCYVHSAILPTFHRRCYWLLQNPDIVLVHYLNVPYPDDTKMAVITPNLALWGDKKEWTKEELVSQLKPMFFSEDEPDATNEIEISTAETVEAIVSQLMEKQRMARQSALVKQLECGCPDANCVDGKSCSHPMRRISAAKSDMGKRGDSGHLSGTAPNVLIGSRMYPRWIDNRRAREQQQQQQHQQTHSSLLDASRSVTPKDTSIHFQVIPTSQQPNHSNNPNSIRAIAGNHHHHQQQQQQQHQNSSTVVVSSSSNLTLTQHLNSLNTSNSSSNSNNNNSQLTSVSSHITNGLSNAHLAAAAAQHHQQQQHRSHMIITSNNSSSASSAAGNSSAASAAGANNQLTANGSNNGNGGNRGSSDPSINLPNNGESHISMLGGQHQQQQQQQSSAAGSTQRTIASGSGSASGSADNVNQRTSSQHHQQQQQDGAGDGLINNGSNNNSSNGSNGSSSNNNSNNNNNNNSSNSSGVGGRHHNHITVDNCAVSSASMVNGSNGGTAGAAPSLVLSLSQLQGSPGSLLILNGQQPSFVCHPSQQQQQQLQSQQLHQQRKASADACKDSSSSNGSLSTSSSIKMENSPSDASQHSLIPKQEIMDSSSSPASSLSLMSGVLHHQRSSPNSSTNGGLFGSYSARRTPARQDGNGHHDNIPFFNETLDLSQEDIQKTLSANMPLGHGHPTAGVTGQPGVTPTDDAMNGEINPMDFIENCGSQQDTVDDDVFVNLDAFDMLVEFPELELDAKSGFFNGSDTGTETGGEVDDGASDLSHFKLSADSGIGLGGTVGPHGVNVSTITDFSPEWAYPEGGIKVLVTGPWSSSSSYTVLFDSFPVPTTLVQNGVLRCYCPAHEVGVVTLQVASDGYVISNAVNFEYKSPPKFETKCEGNGNDMLYKFNLLNRLESIDEKLQIKVEPGELPEDSILFKQANFEDRLVSYCQMLTVKIWRSVTPGSWIGKHRGMTLLHLASALGYAKLVRTMLTWKAENSNVILEAEIDALSQDQDGFTPLMWACSRGHIETAIVLYKWNQTALNVKNNAQQSPLEVAKSKGFLGLLAELEKHESLRLQSKNSRAPTSSSLPTLSSITSSFTTSSTSTSSSAASSSAGTLPTSSSSNASSSLANNSCRSAAAESGQESSSNATTNDSDNQSATGADASPEHNFINDLFNYNDALNSSNSDSNSNDNFALSSAFNPSLSPAALSPYGDGKNHGGGGGSSALTSSNLHYALENNNSNPMLSNALSPNSDSNRSHDGVFLRPGAVFSSGQSPPGARLSKRSSIDSGINMETRPSLNKAGKSLRDIQRMNRADRSMSLPLASGTGGGGQSSPFNSAHAGGNAGSKGSFGSTNGDSENYSLSINDRTTESPSQNSGTLSNASLLSPLRKMDFALCEVSAAESSPMCEDSIETLQEEERHPQCSFGAGCGSGTHPHHGHQLPVHQQDSVEMVPGGSGGTVGDSDVKVLTLAEQIIAAMPERIKNESEEIMSLGSPMPEALSEDTSGMSILTDSFMEPLLDSLPSSQFEEFNFEFSDHNYRYHDVGTPCSSLSPASSGPLQSPASYSIPQDPPVSSPSPPPTTQDFTEFLQTTNSNPFEKDFSNLKLNEREQRELYEAAKCIQKAYRSYKGRKSRMEEQDKERSAAVVIQNYYRRYKQYAYYRQMTQAAVIIQNGYRSYCENKRFKKSQSSQSGQGGRGSGESAEEAASSSQCIQSYYNTYKNEQKQQQQSPQQQQQNNQGSSLKEPSPSGPLKRTYSQRTQNQAARKIQQFMRQSKNKLQRERAEKERQVHQRRAEYLQSLPYPGAAPAAAPGPAPINNNEPLR